MNKLAVKRENIIWIVLAIVVMFVGATYAWYYWTSSTNTDVTFNIQGATVTFDDGSDITNALLLPSLTKEKGMVKTINAKSNIPLYMNLYLTVDTLPDELKEKAFGMNCMKKMLECHKEIFMMLVKDKK